MKILKIFVVLLAASLVFASPLLAEDLQELMNKANALYKKGDYNGTIKALEKVVSMLKEGGNPAGAQQIQTNIGINYIKLKKYPEAIKALEEAKGLYKKPDVKMAFRMDQLLATAHYNMGHYAISAGIREGLIKKYKKLDDKTKADLLAQLADTYRRNEIHSKAILYYGQALKLYVKLKNQDKQALIFTAMALSQSKLADFTGAVKNLQKALTLAEGTENLQNLAETYSNLGIVHWDQGEYAKALDFITKAKEVETKADLKRNLGADFNNEGLIYKSVGNYIKGLASIQQAIDIARSINDKRSEAIALSNRALIYRIMARNDEALKDYMAALKIYEEVKFLEGTASCYLGLGKLYEVDQLDFKKAADNYEKALEIYRRLGNLAYQAESLNQLGRVYKKAVEPDRTTRDLVFEEEEPEMVEASPEEAKEKSLAAYKEALELAQKVNKKEAIWSAQQGIGYALHSQGELEEAFKYYKAAVDTVVNIRGGDSDSELMSDYLKDKEDLFTEAIELLAALYSKTKKKEYMRLQMEYQEIYKNEVMKNAMNTAKVTYEDVKKAKLYEQLTKTLAQKKKLDQLNSSQQNTLAVKPEKEEDKAELETKQKALAKENKQVLVKAKKLDGSIKQLLAKWKKAYPHDENMFNSAAKVNLDKLARSLGKDEAVIQYFPLDKFVNIICVTKEETISAQYPIPINELNSLIRDKFNKENIEGYARKITKLSEGKEKKYFDNCNQTLAKLYEILIKGVEPNIEKKKKLIIVPSKYISYVPFAALVKSFDENGEPHFLVYDKTISYMRLSYFTAGKRSKKKSTPVAKLSMIALGNPVHQKITRSKQSWGMPLLAGAEKEIETVKNIAADNKMKSPVILIREEATEKAWKDAVKKKNYNVMYFATHGVPYAEVLYTQRKLKEKNMFSKPQFKGYYEFIEEQFTEKSPLNGFLLMGYTGEGDENGALTLKEIIGMNEKVFKSAEIAVLSACNTAVTYPAKVGKALREELNSKDVAKKLKKYGLTPGVDQICLSDTFMKRNFRYVMGTLWFAEDETTQYIISQFFANLADLQPPDALRKAQMAYLEKNEYQYTKFARHPYFWAVSAIFGE